MDRKRTNDSERFQIKRLKTVTTRAIKRKTSLFGHIYGRKDDSLIKMVMFARTNGKQEERKTGKKMVTRHRRIQWKRRMVGERDKWSKGMVSGKGDYVIGFEGLRTAGMLDG